MHENNYSVLDRSGYTSVIYRIPGTRKVVKSFFPECVETHFPVEKQAYEHFSDRDHPSSILKYYGMDTNDPAGLVLEFAENGNMYDYAWDADLRGHDKSLPTLYRWARQAAEALAFAHSCGVLHSDIHCVNFVLDSNFDLKVVDWAGASIDSGLSHSSYRTTHSLLCVQGRGARPSMQSEIFAFGSAMYNMITGHDIFPELDYEDDNDEIIRRLRDKEFPDTGSLLALGTVILKCWELDYASMQDVLDAVEAERKEHEEREERIRA